MASNKMLKSISKKAMFLPILELPGTVASPDSDKCEVEHSRPNTPRSPRLIRSDTSIRRKAMRLEVCDVIATDNIMKMTEMMSMGINIVNEQFAYEADYMLPAFEIAYREGSHKIANYLIEQGYNYKPILYDACRTGNHDKVRFILDSGADICAKDYYNNYTLVHIAASKGHIHIVDLLLKNGATLNDTTKCGKSVSNIIMSQIIL
jgi:hypothetical protein